MRFWIMMLCVTILTPLICVLLVVLSCCLTRKRQTLSASFRLNPSMPRKWARIGSVLIRVFTFFVNWCFMPAVGSGGLGDSASPSRSDVPFIPISLSRFRFLSWPDDNAASGPALFPLRRGDIIRELRLFPAWSGRSSASLNDRLEVGVRIVNRLNQEMIQLASFSVGNVDGVLSIPLNFLVDDDLYVGSSLSVAVAANCAVGTMELVGIFVVSDRLL